VKEVFAHLKQFYQECKSQDFAFYMVAGYLVFSYLRPQMIYPWLNFLPWTQICILAGLAYLASKGRLKFQSSHFFVLLLALIAAVGSFNSLYPETSFRKLDIPFIWFVEIVFVTNGVKNAKQLKLFLILLFLILFKMSFFGARVWALRGFGFTSWGISGPPGFFQNSGEFSLLMAILAVLSLAFILAHKKPNVWYYLLPLTAVMSVLGASSRGAQLALIVGLVWINFFILKIKLKNILVVLFIGYVGFTLFPEQQKERFTSMGEDGTSTSRLTYWSAGIEMLNDHPMTGVGYYAFPNYFSDYYSHLKEGAGYSLKREEVSHNSLVQMGSTLGYPGLFVYLALHFLCVSQIRQARVKFIASKRLEEVGWFEKFSVGYVAALITYFIGAFFMSVALYPYIFLMLMISQISLNCSIQNMVKK